jgi:hypothetical protein
MNTYSLPPFYCYYTPPWRALVRLCQTRLQGVHVRKGFLLEMELKVLQMSYSNQDSEIVGFYENKLF